MVVVLFWLVVFFGGSLFKFLWDFCADGMEGAEEKEWRDLGVLYLQGRQSERFSFSYRFYDTRGYDDLKKGMGMTRRADEETRKKGLMESQSQEGMRERGAGKREWKVGRSMSRRERKEGE